MCNYKVIICFIYFLLIFNGVDGEGLNIVNFCAQNTYVTNNTWLQLNKEASSFEYAVERDFKGLHCCAKGYRSIEWYKDNKAYPWPSGVSNLILYPESANQSIYTQTVMSSDSGNYTCLLRNDTHVYSHTIHLHVFDKIPDTPKITYEPKSQAVKLGQSVRLFCEAFVGRSVLPDGRTDAYWKRSDKNHSIEDEAGIVHEKVYREDNQILGAYLVIEKMDKEDYGTYICHISKPDKHIEITIDVYELTITDEIISVPFPWKKVTSISVVLILLLLTTVVLNMRYGLAIRVWFKDRFGNIEQEDGKITDVLICYSQKDAEIVLDVLIPKLESKYNYKCGCREFSSNTNYWHIEMAEASRKTRRVLAVLSPASLNENWDPSTLYQALKQLQALGPPLTCIALKTMPCTVPQIKNAQGETLATILRNIPVILWERSFDESFWLALRLNLPPKRAQISKSNDDISMNAGPNTTRLTSNSRESLEILV